MFGRNPPQRPDQLIQPRTHAGTGPAPQTEVIRAREVIISGPNGGLFVYNSTRTMLEASIAGAPTTDPILGVSVPAGFATYNSHGKVITLLSTSNDAFFQYQDSGAVQGSLILAVASTSGSDPVTAHAYSAGMTGIDPVFGDFINTVGANIGLGQAAYTQNALVAAQAGSGATSPSISVSAPEQGQSGHLVMTIQGTSPDGTHPGQLLIASEPTGTTLPTPVTGATIEMQSPASGITNALLQLITASGGVAGDNMMGFRVSGDANNRLRINADGTHSWRFGGVGAAFTLTPASNTLLQLTAADFDIATIGRGLQIAEGANARQGRVTLAAGTSGAIANTTITANTHIFLSRETIGGGAVGDLSSTRVAGTSFTINSNAGTDASTISWLLTEPG